MTIKQYSKLKPYEDNLYTALYCDYFRNLTQKAKDVIDEVFKEVFNEPSNINVGCGNCQLRTLKKIAKPYFQMKEKLQKKDKETKDKENGKDDNIQ